MSTGEGWTPLFSSLTTGTLCGRWPDIGIWAVVLSLSNRYGEIDVTVGYIARVTGLPEPDVAQCMARFCEPDPQSRSPSENGRRLTLLDPKRSWGWRIVNHQTYRDKARKQAHDQQRIQTGQNIERLKDRRAQQVAQESTPTRPDATRRDPTRPDATRSPKSEAEALPPPINPPPSRGGDDSPRTTRKASKPTAGAVPVDHDRLLDFRLAMPSRAGAQPWRRALAAIRARIVEGHSWDEITAGAKRYATFCQATNKTGTELVMQAATFVGPDKHFLANWDLPKVAQSTAKPLSPGQQEAIAIRRLEDRRAAIGIADFRAALPLESASAYGAAQDAEWQRRQAAKSVAEWQRTEGATSTQQRVTNLQQLSEAVSGVVPPMLTAQHRRRG